MSATEREHVMPPRPLMPWTIALCAGLCASCGLVLNMAADALLGERAAPVTLLMAIPVAAAGCIVLARSCMRLVRWRRWLYAAALGLVAGAVVSAGWAIGALCASRALDNRAASSLEFVVCGDPSINDGAYSYTCDAYAGKSVWVRYGCRVIVSLAPVRMYVLSVEFRALRMMRMGAHACFGASFERLKSSGWYRSTRALQARCLGFETSSLPLSRPRPIQRARSLPALSVDARPSCAPSRRTIGFR